jgi:hypothetical protein
VHSFEQAISSSLQRLWVPHGLNDNLEFILIDPSAADFTDDTFFDYVDNYDSWVDRVYRFRNLLDRLAPKHFSKKIKLVHGALQCYEDLEGEFGDCG